MIIQKDIVSDIVAGHDVEMRKVEAKKLLYRLKEAAFLHLNPQIDILNGIVASADPVATLNPDVGKTFFKPRNDGLRR